MHCRGLAMPCDRRHSPTCSELTRAGPDWQEAQSFQLAIRRWHQGVAEQFNQSVSALALAATETMSLAETLGTAGDGATRVADSLSATDKHGPSTKCSSSNRQSRCLAVEPHSSQRF